MIDGALAHRRKQFMRPDAWRYVKPGTLGYEAPPGTGYQEPAHDRRARELREQKAEEEAKAAAAQADRAFHRELASLRFELALLKLAFKGRRAQRFRFAAKAGFDPDQPRVPAGNSDGGQWTDGGAGGEESTNGGPTVQSILGLAKQIAASGRSPTYLKCLDICSPLLERRQPPGSDRNKYDFHRCMSICIGR